MNAISVLKESSNYVIIRIPRKLAVGFGITERKPPTEKEILALSREATRLHRLGRLPTLRSLRDLR